MTVFMSTHQIYVADEMADRVGIFHRGRIIAAGTPAELRRKAGTDGALEKAFLAITEDEGTSTTAQRPANPAP
jgi:ABC-2 type transport system ATP-binding protein